jgi:hypothetical protein
MSYYIYKICCDDFPDYVYVGSTKAFRQRKNSHKKDYKRGDTKILYTTIRENGGWENWRMVIVEELGEVSLTQSRIKEEEYRVKLNANLNSYMCHKTDEDKEEYKYNYNRRECVKERKAQWNIDHKDKRQQKIKCECGREISYTHFSRHKKTDIHLDNLKKLEN